MADLNMDGIDDELNAFINGTIPNPNQANVDFLANAANGGTGAALNAGVAQPFQLDTPDSFSATRGKQGTDFIAGQDTSSIAAPGASSTPGDFWKPGGTFSNITAGVNAATNLYGAYTAHKRLGVAQDTLDFQKKYGAEEQRRAKASYNNDVAARNADMGNFRTTRKFL